MEIPFVVRLLRLPRGGHVLLVGCGTGAAIPALVRCLAPASLTAIDLDPDEVVAGRSRRLAGSLLAADVTALPFAAGSFDLVVDFGTCHHVREPSSALHEIAWGLRPGGLFVHETPIAQAVAHPRRFHRQSPWPAVPRLPVLRHAGLWVVRRKA